MANTNTPDLTLNLAPEMEAAFIALLQKRELLSINEFIEIEVRADLAATKLEKIKDIRSRMFPGGAPERGGDDG